MRVHDILQCVIIHLKNPSQNAKTACEKLSTSVFHAIILHFSLVFVK